MYFAALSGDLFHFLFHYLCPKTQRRIKKNWQVNGSLAPKNTMCRFAKLILASHDVEQIGHYRCYKKGHELSNSQPMLW